MLVPCLPGAGVKVMALAAVQRRRRDVPLESLEGTPVAA